MDGDEWRWVLDTATMLRFTGAAKETLRRWTAEGISQPILLPGDVRGAERYWDVREAVVTRTIAKFALYRFGDVNSLEQSVRRLIPLEAEHVRPGSGLYWVEGGGGDLIREYGSPTEISVFRDGQTPLGGLDRVELVSTIVPVEVASWWDEASGLAVERNMSAIKRDPSLRRKNYKGWKSYSATRPDRRPEQPPLFDD